VAAENRGGGKKRGGGGKGSKHRQPLDASPFFEDASDKGGRKGKEGRGLLRSLFLLSRGRKKRSDRQASVSFAAASYHAVLGRKKREKGKKKKGGREKEAMSKGSRLLVPS